MLSARVQELKGVSRLSKIVALFLINWGIGFATITIVLYSLRGYMSVAPPILISLLISSIMCLIMSTCAMLLSKKLGLARARS